MKIIKSINNKRSLYEIELVDNIDERNGEKVVRELNVINLQHDNYYMLVSNDYQVQQRFKKF